MSLAQTRTEIVELPQLCVRAAIGSIDEESRTVELVFTTGAPVVRYDWRTDTRYLERLSLKPEHMRLDRLNASAPLLDTHSAWSLGDQIGVVVPQSIALSAKEARAKVRFSRREEVEPIWRDVLDQIYKNVSVGYAVYRYEEVPGKAGGLPTRTATDWEPHEISMVPMPADIGAQVRSKEVRTYPCEIVRRSEPAASTSQTMVVHRTETVVTQEKNMAEATGATLPADDQPSEFLRAEDPATGAAPTQRLGLGDPAEPTAAEAAQKVERARVQGILLACRAAKMPSALFDRLMGDGVTLEEAQRQIFVELAKRVDPQPNQGPSAASFRVEMGDDPFVHKRKGIEEALLFRVNPEKFPLTDGGREYRGMSMLDIAKAYLQARGERISDLDRMTIAGKALGIISLRGGYHTTSDFPLLLADVANKSLRADYEAAPQTFMPITKMGTVPDFKLSNRVQLGDAPALKPVGEDGEFTRGTIEEGREQVQAATYGRVFAITRQALVNDDLDAFSSVPTKFGRMARNLESDLVWYQILKNANMADSNALFSAAHLNYAGAGDISVVNIGAGEKAMLLQRGLDGTTLISAMPKYLIVGPTKKVQAQQFVSQNMMANTRDNINPFAGQLTVIVEPRLETGITIGPLSATGSAFAWYLAADKAALDILELVMLEGQSGPVIESRVGFDIDGLEIKCRHDVGAKAIDWRGLYKSDGSDAS